MMVGFHNKVIYHYKPYLKDREFWTSFFISFIFLLFSLVINSYAGRYATARASNAVTDLVLSNTPVFDVYYVYVYGAILFWVFVGFLCLIHPRRIPFVLKSVSLFVLTRSLFISLTHIAPPVSQIAMNSGIMNKFSYGGDLFFSGHTGLPFLMALIFWENVQLRLFFIAISILFGVTVLLGHIHYSIDVLSAFFITYTIYRLALKLFKRDGVCLTKFRIGTCPVRDRGSLRALAVFNGACFRSCFRVLYKYQNRNY